MSILPDTRPIPLEAPACPAWCTDHYVTPEPDGTTQVVHHGTAAVAGYHVGSRLGLYVETDGSLSVDPVEVVIDHQAVTVAEARQLIARLTLAVELATGGAR